MSERRALRPYKAHLVNLAHNDPFLLSKHPEVICRSQAYAAKWGTSSQSSRLVTGNLPIHEELESTLVEMTGRQAALLFASGFQANMTLLSAIVEPHETVVLDRLCHHSLIQGAKLSGAKMMRYRDLNHLELLLAKHKVAWVITEGVFSMDGHQAPIDEIQALCVRFGAKLYVDEAHSFGVTHLQARGDLSLVPFGKAVGNFGAAVLCSKSVKEHLINFCGGVIYSTALPPSVVGGVQAALELLPSCPREELLRRARSIGLTDSHIVPLVVGSSEEALKLSSQLEKCGILIPAIRPPTVPRGTSRLRLSMNMQVDLQKIFDTFNVCGFPLGGPYARPQLSPSR